MKKFWRVFMVLVLGGMLGLGCGERRPVKPRRGAHWVPGHYVKRGGPRHRRRIWVPGHWK